MRRSFAVPALLIGVLVIAGVSVWAFAQTPSGIEEFNREQAASDRVLLGENPLGIVPETVRLLAVDDGIKYLAARSEDEKTCLILVPDGEKTATASACGGGDVIGTSTPDGSMVHLYEMGMGDMEPEGLRQLAPNLYVTD